MKWLITALLTFTALVTGYKTGEAQKTTSNRVFVVKIEGMIDNGLAKYIERSFDAADKAKAEGVILHVDTFGGLVDAADEIRKSILNSPLPTAAYIDKNAASAGALISLACDSIYMAPGASIGAATVVQGGSGEKASEKMQSYMRGLMRSTAEANGRNPQLAEAMVDESIAIDGIIGEGKLLTLSSSEAHQYGISNATLESIDAVKNRMRWTDAVEIDMNQRWEESFLRFLANPVVSSILMLLMMAGLYFELQSPGVGFPGIMAGMAALLFFAPLYIMGLAQSWEIVLFIIGVILIIIEIFFIPGFGVPGILGVTLVIFSLGAALIGNVGLEFPAVETISRAIWTLAITLIIGVIMIFSLARYLPNTRRFSQLVLSDSSDRSQGYISATPQADLVGMEGQTLTPLRPSGTVKIEDKRIDVVSEGDFIDQGEPVVVVSAVGSRVVVSRKVENV